MRQKPRGEYEGPMGVSIGPFARFLINEKGQGALETRGTAG